MESAGFRHGFHHPKGSNALFLVDMFAALRMLFVFVLFGAPAAAIGIPWSALRRNFSTMYKWGMAVLRLGVRASGIIVRVEGLENVPVGESCIFLSNHVSNLDPPILLPALPGMNSVFLKKSLMKIPLLGTAMRMGKFVPVTRGGSREEAAQSVSVAADALRSGLNIFIFPEGTRSKDGSMLPFKKGAFFLAAETLAPMVPIVITGTAEMMRKGSLRIYPGVAVIRFLPVVRPTEYGTKEQLMEAVRSKMEAALADSRNR
jgi:1-acyl-sn-glycerol-3-phosphate acyltransferase